MVTLHDISQTKTFMVFVIASWSFIVFVMLLFAKRFIQKSNRSNTYYKRKQNGKKKLVNKTKRKV